MSSPVLAVIFLRKRSVRSRKSGLQKMSAGPRDPLFIPAFMANDSQHSAAVVLLRAIPIVLYKIYNHY